MAGLTDNTTYTGKEAEGFYSTGLLTGTSKTRARQVLNNKNTQKVASLDVSSGFLQEDDCDLEESGTYSLGTVDVDVCDVGFKIPFCIKDWETNYLSAKMKAGSNVEENYPNGVVDYILEQVALKISEKTESLFFTGDTAGSPPDLCDGIQKRLLADATVLDVAKDGTKLHAASTVIGELTRMYNELSKVMLAKQDKLEFWVNPDTARAYRLAMIATYPYLYASNDANLTLTFMGIPMVVCPGLGDYKAILTEPGDTLIYSTDLTSDEMYVSFEKKPNSKKHYAIGSFKFGTQIIKGGEIVYYN